MKIALAFLAWIVLSATANLLMKTGATQSPHSAAHWVAIMNWRVVAGIASMGIAVIFYVWLLRWLPLNIVQSFGAAQFIATAAASSLILHERISLGQTIGIVLIAFGIATVAWYAD